jgi:chromosome segregation ATPase
MPNIKLTFILLLSLLLLGTVSRVGKAEPVYTVSESELSAMKHYIAVIRQEQRKLRDDLNNCKISLQQAEEQRRNLESQLNELINKYRLLAEERSELEMLLKDLRESFAQSKKEAERKIKNLIWQRNIGVLLGLALALL